MTICGKLFFVAVRFYPKNAFFALSAFFPRVFIALFLRFSTSEIAALLKSRDFLFQRLDLKLKAFIRNELTVHGVDRRDHR